MNREVVSMVLAILLAGLVALPGCGASKAELDECKALVTEQSTTIEEQGSEIAESESQLEAKDVRIVELEEENAQLQKEIEELLETEIGKTENERAEDSEAPKDPTYMELLEFMWADITNEKEYLVPGTTNQWNHLQYALDFLRNAEAKGIRGYPVTIWIEEGETWFFTGFETTDKGWVYILPAIEREVKLEVDKEYHQLNNFSPFGVDDTIVEITIHKVERGIKYGKIDGNIDDWPSDIAMKSDPAKDLTGAVENERGVNLKAVQAFMNEDYLYVAIQIYDVFDLSLRRNYFIAVDCDKDGQDEYHFGVRPSGRTWVFDHTTDPNNWISETAFDVAAYGETNVIEVEIPRKAYEIPSSIYIYCRVTQGGPTVDSTGWFEVWFDVSLDRGT